MKHWMILTALVLVGCLAIVLAERKKVTAQASPDALVYFIGSSEQEMTRIPVQLTRISDAEEIQIGDAMAKNYGGNLERDSAISATERDVREYVQQVGARVAVRAQRKLPYRFHYIPDPNLVNAFALPGGHVFIGQGLINLMDSEDELASVLGHEVEHIDLRHAVERVQLQAHMRRLKLGTLGSLINIPVQVMEAGYSKQQELAADREGTKIAVLSGYSPQGALRMFETFEHFEPGYKRKPGSPEDEMATVVMASLGEYFRTHPPSALRAEEIRKLIAEEMWSAKPETDLRIAYVRWGTLARAAYDQRKYQQAIQYAKRSLARQPRQQEFLRLTARSEFMLGNFAAAAKSYRDLLSESSDTEDERAFADALAATHGRNASAEFEAWAASVAPSSDRMAVSIRVDRAGLRLLGGDTKAIEGIDREISAIDKEYTPEMLARIGWWFYRATKPDKAFELIERAGQMRPGDELIWRMRMWPLIEMRRYGDVFSSAASHPQGSESIAARVTANWLSLDHDAALNLFSDIASDPSWTNRNWVEGNYSVTVAEALEQIKQERERRRIAGKR